MNETTTAQGPCVDHLVVFAADLAGGVDWCQRTLGISPTAGGEHPLMGTHNRLLALGGGAYLEIIAIDPDAAAPEPPRRGSEVILVVEDDQLVRNYVVTQLGSLGYKTIAVPDSRAALALVDKGEKFDLLFTDVIMPGGMNGRQLADEVRKRRPGLKVLYTSGYTENAIVHHGRLDEGVLLLAKPYRKAQLASMLQQALGE